MEWIRENLSTIIIVILLLVAVFFAVRSIVKEKGRCAFCSHKDSCPVNSLKKIKNSR